MAHEMPRIRSHPVVAVFDASEDTAEMLETWLESQGCATVNAHAGDDERDIHGFIAAHDPEFIIWDVAPPYDVNWEFFRWLRKNDVLVGRRVLITTTAEARLEALAAGDAARPKFSASRTISTSSPTLSARSDSLSRNRVVPRNQIPRPH